MWRRGRNRANPGVVPPRNRGSDGRSRDVLSGGSGNGGSRHGDSGSSGGSGKTRVGASGRGRRRLTHSRPKVMPSTRLHHNWAGEGVEMERMGGRKVSKMKLNGKERRGRGGLNR